MLASHQFEAPEAVVAFTQRNVQEFLAAAGYPGAGVATTSGGAQLPLQPIPVGAAVPAASGSVGSSAGASQHTARGDTKPGTTIKAASLAVSTSASAAGPRAAAASWNSSGSSGPKAQAARTAAAESARERRRMQAAIARRYSYSKVDQMARKALAELDWSLISSACDCVDILEAFYAYQHSNEFAPRSLNLSAIVAEIRLTVQYFSRQRLWPRWVLQPHDALLKRVRNDHAADVDYGNELWELMVNLMNVSSAIESVVHQEAFNAPAHAPYGDRVNSSRVGSYNVRGNVIERLLSWLVETRLAEPR